MRRFLPLLLSFILISAGLLVWTGQEPTPPAGPLQPTLEQIELVEEGLEPVSLDSSRGLPPIEILAERAQSSDQLSGYLKKLKLDDHYKTAKKGLARAHRRLAGRLRHLIEASAVRGLPLGMKQEQEKKDQKLKGPGPEDERSSEGARTQAPTAATEEAPARRQSPESKEGETKTTRQQNPGPTPERLAAKALPAEDRGPSSERELVNQLEHASQAFDSDRRQQWRRFQRKHFPLRLAARG